MHLGVFVLGTGNHSAGWRCDGAATSNNDLSVIQEIACVNPCVHGLRMSRNYGQHNALLCGIRAARLDTIVTLDDDLQNPPEEIPKLLARLEYATKGTP